MDKSESTTRQKALAINLDATTYGTFAEIGGGQEVARWFFLVGGAAGTVAKTISAYDMSVSDSLYGPAKRYVSRERLEAMLRLEFAQLLERLDPSRGEAKKFFAFANTVATTRYGEPGKGRGWLGVPISVPSSRGTVQRHHSCSPAGLNHREPTGRARRARSQPDSWRALATREYGGLDRFTDGRSVSRTGRDRHDQAHRTSLRECGQSLA